jgi:hypothetical protein
MKPTFFKGVALGAGVAVLVVAATTALAGTGVGDVFNLGQTNSVDQTSSLQGTVSGNPQLQLTNLGSGAGVRADAADGRGVVGNHTAATGGSAGVEGTTRSTSPNATGVQGRVLPANADPTSAGVRGINSRGSGVFGSAAFGNGVKGTGVIGVDGESTTAVAEGGFFKDAAVAAPPGASTATCSSTET